LILKRLNIPFTLQRCQSLKKLCGIPLRTFG
jgi:hypothetical protein